MEIDWKQAPKRARWWAVDANGHARWYCSPDIKPFTNFWGVDELPAPTFGFSGDWRASLTERPLARIRSVESPSQGQSQGQ